MRRAVAEEMGPRRCAGLSYGGTYRRPADGRLPVSDGGGLLRKTCPEHWSFLRGETARHGFVVRLLTGVWVTLFFDPSMTPVVYDGSLYTSCSRPRCSPAGPAGPAGPATLPPVDAVAV
ncbi:hypothetical protein [Streptomyces sp. NPDC048225]|uniref:hypothetical protein n=1 Tax=Streptomyces sp. NPDC048225 TaxID=3365518 RepID=UPI0037219E7B